MIKVETDALTTPSSTGDEGGASPAAMPRPRLVLIDPDTAQEFFLEQPTVIIGRTPDNDVALNFKSIGRHHAEIVRDGERYFIMDLKSANGVKVNGALCKRVPLRSGDIIGLGRVRLRFDRGDARQPRPEEGLRFDGRARVASGIALVAALAILGLSRIGAKEPPRPLVAATHLPGGVPVAAPPGERLIVHEDYTAVLRGAVPTVEPEDGHHLAADHLARAENRRQEGRCSEARREAEAALALDPDNRAARKVLIHCARRPARAPARRVALTRSATPPSEAPGPAERPAPAAAPPAPVDIAPRPEGVKPRRRAIEDKNPYLDDHQ
jgi:hypothetical protein